jgi:hypothetical protein
VVRRRRVFAAAGKNNGKNRASLQAGDATGVVALDLARVDHREA